MFCLTFSPTPLLHEATCFRLRLSVATGPLLRARRCDAAFPRTHLTMWHLIAASFTLTEFAISRCMKVLVGNGPRP